MNFRPEIPTHSPYEVICNDRERLEATIQDFKKDGPEKMYVLADFDRTLTTAKPVPSVTSEIRSSGVLGPEYATTSSELFKKYYPIEINYNLNPEERAAKMQEWQEQTNNLLIKLGLTKQMLDQIIDNPGICFRQGLEKFLAQLGNSNIPLVLMSSGPRYLIEGHLKKAGLYRPGIHIIANEYEFDETGKLLRIKEPIINLANKAKILVAGHECHQDVADRPNVLVLGDNIDDLDMVEGSKFDNLLSVGFLNDETDPDSRQKYSLSFDAVVTGDGPMDFPNKLVGEITA